MTSVALPTFDGTEVLGFMAAVGLMELVTEIMPAEQPRLSFSIEGVPALELTALEDLASLAALVDAHIRRVHKAGNALNVPDPTSLHHPDRARPHQVASHVRDLVGDGLAVPERMWLRAISTDSGTRTVRSPIVMTLRNATLFGRGRQLLELLAAMDPSATRRALAESPLMAVSRAVAASGWDRHALSDYTHAPASPAVAVLHEWLAIHAIPAFPLEARPEVTAACWYPVEQEGRQRLWFAWPLWRPALTRTAVRHLLTMDLRVRGDAEGVAVTARPHPDVHAVWAARRTRLARGGSSGNDDPFLDEPVRLQVRAG